MVRTLPGGFLYLLKQFVFCYFLKKEHNLLASLTLLISSFGHSHSIIENKRILKCVYDQREPVRSGHIIVLFTIIRSILTGL